MAMFNLTQAYQAQQQAVTPEGKKATSKYIQLASRIIADYGKDTDNWPNDILQELMKAGREAYDVEGAAARLKKARETGGVTLADY